MLTRDEILNRAERHSKMTAGWIFNAQGLEKFWREAYEAGRKSERENCAALTEHLGQEGMGTLAIAAAMRKRK
jgi:hypothetical protein